MDTFFHYAFLDGRLIGSEHPAACGRERERLLSILPKPIHATLLTLTRQNLIQHAIPGLEQRHLAMPDVPSRAQIAQAVEAVESGLAQGRHVWVHCQKGIDRTACVIGASLVRTGISPDAAIAMLMSQFPAQRRTARMIDLWRPNAEMIRSFAVGGE